MSEIKLKPCPFCGGKNIKALYIDSLEIERCVEGFDEDEFALSSCYVHCYDCDMDFCPRVDKIQETIDAWNRRIENG